MAAINVSYITLSDEKEQIIKDSISELQPFMNSYSLMYFQCPTTKQYNAKMIFKFKPNVDLSLVSYKCKEMWDLDTLHIDTMTDSPQSDYIVSRTIPRHIVYAVYPCPEIFHFDDDVECL